MHLDIEYTVTLIHEDGSDPVTIGTAPSVQLAMALAARYDLGRWDGDRTDYVELSWAGVMDRPGLLAADRYGSHYAIVPRIHQVPKRER